MGRWPMANDQGLRVNDQGPVANGQWPRAHDPGPRAKRHIDKGTDTQLQTQTQIYTTQHTETHDEDDDEDDDDKGLTKSTLSGDLEYFDWDRARAPLSGGRSNSPPEGQWAKG